MRWFALCAVAMLGCQGSNTFQVRSPTSAKVTYIVGYNADKTDFVKQTVALDQKDAQDLAAALGTLKLQDIQLLSGNPWVFDFRLNGFILWVNCSSRDWLGVAGHKSAPMPDGFIAKLNELVSKKLGKETDVLALVGPKKGTK